MSDIVYHRNKLSIITVIGSVGFAILGWEIATVISFGIAMFLGYMEGA